MNSNFCVKASLCTITADLTLALFKLRILPTMERLHADLLVNLSSLQPPQDQPAQTREVEIAKGDIRCCCKAANSTGGSKAKIKAMTERFYNKVIKKEEKKGFIKAIYHKLSSRGRKREASWCG